MGKNNPCISCEFRMWSKDSEVCLRCDKRIAYVRALSGGELDADGQNQFREAMMSDSTTSVKKCKTCGQVKPVDDFEPHKLCKDGRLGSCRACRAAAKSTGPKTQARPCKKAKKKQGVPDIPTPPPVPEKKKAADLSATQAAIVLECDSIKEMLLTKNAEYGDSAVRPVRIFSTADPEEQIRVRIDDKLSRLANRGPKNITEDTEADLIGYLVLLRVSRRIGVV